MASKKTAGPSTTATVTTTPAKPAPSTVAKSGSPSTGPTNEQIAKRAYEIYLARGGQHGRQEEDWLQAERELKLGRQ